MKKQILALFALACLCVAGCGKTVLQPVDPAPAPESPSPQSGSSEDREETDSPMDQTELECRMKEREEEYWAQRGGRPTYDDYEDHGITNFIGNVFSSKDVMMTTGNNATMVMTESAAEDAMPVEASPQMAEDYDTAEFSYVRENGFVSTSSTPLSTIAADVDTASYSLLRMDTITSQRTGEKLLSWLDKDAIRVEEMVNYFDYDYPAPADEEMFSVTTEVASCPWNEDTELLMVGVRSKEAEKPKGSNIVLLIDTSGSMFGETSLGLVQKAMDILVDQLGENDRVSIVTYAGSSDIAAAGMSGAKKEELKGIIDSLEAYGSTNGGEGIISAYDLAEKYFVKGGVNRVILCTDGDLNVGITSEAGLIDLIEQKKETGVFLSVMGVGYANYSDTRMEALADHGNGNYTYIDCIDEAKRVLEKEFWKTTQTVAKDVKLQLDFNPAKIKGYRQIGYENRAMAAEDFSDDTKDGGEVGAGQTVTVLYEIVPVDSKMEIAETGSRYTTSEAFDSEELLTVSIRYKEPDADTSELKEYPVLPETGEMSDNLSWAAGVAQTGMLLRESDYAGTSTFQNIKERLSRDPRVFTDDWRLEFMLLLSKYASED